MDELIKLKATNYRYVGGRYGRSSEKEIMEELMKNGPVVMNFEPTYEFMYYERGIYHSKDAASWIVDNQSKPNWVMIDRYILKKFKGKS